MSMAGVAFFESHFVSRLQHNSTPHTITRGVFSIKMVFFYVRAISSVG